MNGADEVPDQGQVSQFELFAQGFLQVVLAKVTQAGGICFAQGLGGFGLADREQLDAVFSAVCSCYRCLDARTNQLDVVCYRGHQEAPAVGRFAAFYWN
ncbi:hypothetical protein D3C87_1989300 [compost metagenome]